MKKLFCLLLIILFVFALTYRVHAESEKTIVFTIDSTIYTIDGEIQTDLPAAPFIVPTGVNEGRTMIPLRVVSKTLGAGVTWDQSEQTVQILFAIPLQSGGQQNKEIIITVGNSSIIIVSSITDDPSNPENGNISRDEKKIDAPAQIRNGVTFLPIRCIAEIFFSTVDWDSQKREVTLHPRVGFIPAHPIPGE